MAERRCGLCSIELGIGPPAYLMALIIWRASLNRMMQHVAMRTSEMTKTLFFSVCGSFCGSHWFLGHVPCEYICYAYFDTYAELMKYRNFFQKKS